MAFPIAIPIAVAAAGLASGAAKGVFGGKKTPNYVGSSEQYGQSLQNAQGAYDGDIRNAQQLLNNQQAGAQQYNWQNTLQAASQMRQDANAYEINQATQAGLAAYGGDPLSGGARAAVSDRQQQLARQNWQQSLDNANAMTGRDLATQMAFNQQSQGLLGEQRNARMSNNLSAAENMYGARTAAQEWRAAQPTAMDRFLTGFGQGTQIGANIFGAKGA